MIDRSAPTVDGSPGWKPIPSTVTDRDLDALEAELGASYPPLYREFLKYLHFVDLTERGVRFAEHLPGQWGDRLRKLCFSSWDPTRIVRRGLVPFGSECSLDAGPVCFDTRRRAPDGDCPVVFWDHEWVGTEREVQPMFSSTRKMFEPLKFAARTDENFLYWDAEEDGATLLAKKRELLARFLAIDPDGAGRAARSYWIACAGEPARDL